MPSRRIITLLLAAFAALAATITPRANAATISKTASGDFSAPAHMASAIFGCNSRQALGKTRIATTEGVCAFSYGKEADQLSRLNYYGYRYYDPLSLTWTQADPLFRFVPDLAYDQPRLMSLYAFSLNNPVRYVDPDGRHPESSGGWLQGAWDFITNLPRAVTENGNSPAIDKLFNPGGTPSTKVDASSAYATAAAAKLANTRAREMADSRARRLQSQRSSDDDDDYDASTEDNGYHDRKGEAAKPKDKQRRRAKESSTAQEKGDQREGVGQAQGEARQDGVGDGTIQSTTKSEDAEQNAFDRIKEEKDLDEQYD